MNEGFHDGMPDDEIALLEPGKGAEGCRQGEHAPPVEPFLNVAC